MADNPVLIEVLRGPVVENIHRGAVSVCSADGSDVLTIGDVERPAFPRSAIKAMQALAIFRSGADRKFALTEEDLALACASHGAEDMHVAGVRAFLERVGLGERDLECGAHAPSNAKARAALRADGGKPGAIHNNCSGKHTGMLAVARALNVSHEGYVERDHPVQKLVRECVETVIGTKLDSGKCGTDGCSIPTWAAPLRAFATGFARMATGQGLSDADADASRKLFDAATSHPVLVGGTGNFDSECMTVFGGRVMIKVGAEGVYCGAVRDKGTGFALKVDDGNMVAAEAVAAALLLRTADPGPDQAAFLLSKAVRTNSNWRKIEVGGYRPAGELALT